MRKDDRDPGTRLSALIVSKRTLLDLTPTKLAELLEMSQPMLSRIEAKKRFPSPKLLVQLCQWLGVSAEFIVTGSEHDQTACSHCVEYELILKGIRSCLDRKREGDTHDVDPTVEASAGSDLASNQRDLQGSRAERPEWAGR